MEHQEWDLDGVEEWNSADEAKTGEMITVLVIVAAVEAWRKDAKGSPSVFYGTKIQDKSCCNRKETHDCTLRNPSYYTTAKASQ